MSGVWRTVRVFVSSTFRDMQAERDVLAKHVFPRVRKLCEQRGVGFVEVDLRWGVTEEQAQRGEVLPICLAEIDRCPYFIGLLGERYGWVPDEIPQELVGEQVWLAEHVEKSVTELEIVHGVLRNPAMANRACFYFRNPAYVERLPPEQRCDFTEADPDARQKQRLLKERIRDNGLVCEDYADPKALGELVLRDLVVAINQTYPPGQPLDGHDRETFEHEAFAQGHVGVYVVRQEDFDLLDQHARGSGPGPGLVVLGESGSGKSALLANWALGYRERHSGDAVLLHFIGATASSTDWMAMLRHILEQWRRRFGIDRQIPDKPDEMRRAFPNWLHIAAARGRVILVLDALNQLEDRDGAPDLVWLPPTMPANVRLIVSTLPGRPFEELTRRGWPTLTVKPFHESERKAFIHDYLAQFSKSLSAARTARIAAAPASGNPLYLRSLLDELRVFGIHGRLDQRIDYYLSAATVGELYERILERYEADYETDRPGLVRDTMALLWAARRGLSEPELLKLLGTDGKPLARAAWSPLSLAADRSLVSRSGLLGFFHDHLRQAVRKRYLPTADRQRDAYLRLADHFDRRQLDSRKIDELPWQLAQASSWQRLYDLLADLTFFKALWDFSEFEVKRYWSRMEQESPLRLLLAYNPVLEDPARHHEHIWNMAKFLADVGHSPEALKLYKYLVEHCRQSGDRTNLAGSLGNLATVLAKTGDYREAIRLFKEEEQFCRESGDARGLSDSLGSQALILADLGNPRAALRLHEEEARICRELWDPVRLSRALAGQANVLCGLGDRAGAMRLLLERAQACREVGDDDGLARSLGNQAVILKEMGKLKDALQLHVKEEQICRELGDKGGIAKSLGNQAVIRREWGEPDAAMRLHQQEESMLRQLGDEGGLQVSLGNQAMLLRNLGRLDEAAKLLGKQEQICRASGNLYGLQASLGNQALICQSRGDLHRAMQLHKEEERICRQLEYKSGVKESIGNQALVLLTWGRLEEAMRLLEEQERMCRELHDMQGLSVSLGNQGLVCQAEEKLDRALTLFRQQERICRELGTMEGLADSLCNQAVLLVKGGKMQDAMRLLKEQESICRRMNHKDGLSCSLGNQAGILWELGDAGNALRLLREQERLCRELENVEAVAMSLVNQALLLAETMNEPGKALPLAEESYRLAVRCGLGDLAGHIKQILEALRASGR